MSSATTIREHVHEALHTAGPSGLTMAALTGSVTGPWRSRDVQAMVRRLWELNELGRRSDGTFVLTQNARRRSDPTSNVRRSRRRLDAAVRRVAADARRDGYSTKITTRTVDPALLRAFCPRCRLNVSPRLDGTCTACGTQTGANVEQLTRPRRRRRRKPLRKGQPGWGRMCRCGAAKNLQAHSCRGCSNKRRSGRQLGPRPNRRRPQKISEDLLLECRRLYATGLSLRQIAAQVHPQTTYKSVHSCAEGLHSLFKTRGWKLRPQAEVTRARNFKHGRKPRARSNEQEVSYRHWLAKQRGWKRVSRPGQPTCKAVKQQPPGKGKPCQRPSIEGSEYCQSHDPQRALQRHAHLARMRAVANYREPLLPVGPFAEWLVQLRDELGDWRAVARLIGADQSAVHRWGTGKVQRVAARVVQRSAENAGTTLEVIYADTDLAVAA